jgi:hypothetical protein
MLNSGLAIRAKNSIHVHTKRGVVAKILFKRGVINPPDDRLARIKLVRFKKMRYKSWYYDNNKAL